MLLLLEVLLLLLLVAIVTILLIPVLSLSSIFKTPQLRSFPTKFPLLTGLDELHGIAVSLCLFVHGFWKVDGYASDDVTAK